MSYGMENSATTGKRRNSTVYVAKSASGETNTNLSRIGIQHESCSAGEKVADGEFPRRDSVLTIKNVFEKVVKSTGSCSQRDFAGGKLRETLIDKKLADNLSQCVHGDRSSTSQSGTLKSPISESQISSGSVQPEARFEAAEHVTACGIEVAYSEQQPDSKTYCRGSLLMQPASNIRGTLAKVEYLSLNKFNDVKTYACSKKRPKMAVDELDKRLEASESPVTADIDDVVDPTCAYDNDLQSQEELDKEFACEFVGAGVKGSRPVLKSSKSRVNKKVSFCLRSTSVFEYPAEQVDTTGSNSAPGAELNASESLNEDETEPTDGERPNITSKSLQSSPGCSATGMLGSYQSRLLEHYALSPCYSTEASSLQLQQQQYFEMNDSLRQRVNMAQPLLVSSCSADEPSRPWSDGNSGTELLF